MKKIGFTTTIPVEAVFAAGLQPVDLNNIFITDKNPGKFIESAENAGFPRNTCAWIKGIYSAILKAGDIDTIISVVEGDCSNTRALSEVLELRGIKCLPFSYPNSREYSKLKDEISNLCNFFNVTFEDCIGVKTELDEIRKKLKYIDELTWKHNKAKGFENHIWQVSSSDFNGDYNTFEQQLDEAINDIEQREAKKEKIRIGYIGVPPIYGDLYDYVETLDARVVFNEVQRQFTMADGAGSKDIVEVYRQFTYPYNLAGRMEDIKREISARNIDGIIHYTQAFCFRGIEDIVVRSELDVPVLSLEGDKPGSIDARTMLRIESFIDMLK